MSRMNPETTAQKVYALEQKRQPIKAHGIRLKFEEQASEQDYDDYLFALDKLNTYGVC